MMTQSNPLRLYRILTILFFIFSPILSTPSKFNSLSTSSNQLLALLTGLFSIYAWYYFDSEIVNYQRSKWLDFTIIAIALIGIPYYLFKSRGIKNGFICVLIASVFCVLSWLVSETFLYLLHH